MNVTPNGESFEADIEAARVKAEAYEAGQEVNEEHASESPQESDSAEGNGEQVEASSEPDQGTELPEDGDDQDGELREASRGGRKQRLRHSETVDPEAFEAFKAQAEELGYNIDDRGVTPQERAKWRIKMREDRASLQQEYETQLNALESRGAALAEKFEKAEALATAIDEGDHDAIASALGYDSWLAVNQAFAHKTQSPQYKQMQALQRKVAEAEKREKAQQEAMERARQEEAAAAQRAETSEELKDFLLDSDDDLDQRLAENGKFRDTVIHYLEQSFDGKNTIGVDEAKELALKDMQALYEELHHYLGAQSADESSDMPSDGATIENLPRNRATAAKPRRKPKKAISQQQAVEASSPEPSSLDDNAWFDKWSKKLKDATPHNA